MARKRRAPGKPREATTVGDVVHIQLTRGAITTVSVEDADLAGFLWCVQGHYAWGCMGQKPARALHRVILARMIGRDLVAGEEADHINGNGFDNRRCNLRLSTRALNAMNRPAPITNTSGYKGVSREGKRWRAAIQVAGAVNYLGAYQTAEEAARVYDSAAREHFGEFAYLNFPNNAD